MHILLQRRSVAATLCINIVQRGARWLLQSAMQMDETQAEKIRNY